MKLRAVGTHSARCWQSESMDQSSGRKQWHQQKQAQSKAQCISVAQASGSHASGVVIRCGQLQAQMHTSTCRCSYQTPDNQDGTGKVRAQPQDRSFLSQDLVGSNPTLPHYSPHSNQNCASLADHQMRTDAFEKYGDYAKVQEAWQVCLLDSSHKMIGQSLAVEPLSPTRQRRNWSRLKGSQICLTQRRPQASAFTSMVNENVENEFAGRAVAQTNLRLL